MNPWIETCLYYAPIVLFIYLFLVEWLAGYYSRARMGRNDQIINFLALLQDRVVVQPTIAFVSAYLFGHLIPQYKGALSDAPFWPSLIIFMLSQDFIHYWFHRKAHEWKWLWRLHRTHHSSSEMSLMVTARLNILWQLILPVTYYAGAAIYLGLTKVFFIAYTIKQLITLSTHSDRRFDLFFYKFTWFRPILWLYEHVFTTADAHHAHHGIGDNGCPMGNYAPVMMFWDFVFGTAKLPHQRQQKIGIYHDAKDHWLYQLYWPFPVSQDSWLNKKNASKG